MMSRLLSSRSIVTAAVADVAKGQMMAMGTMVRRRKVAAAAAAVLGLGAVTLAAPALAGEPPPVAIWDGEVITAAECVEGQGVVLVDIFDEFSAEYDVFLYLGEQFVDSVEEITDTDEGEETVEFGPLADGTYTVFVYWIDEDQDVFEGDVTVDCTADVTPTVPTSTTSAAPAPAAAAAASAAPRFTG
jgi:hypothetical protein